MGLDRTSTPGGFVNNKQKIPEVGTMGWVKWGAEEQRKHERMHNKTGGW
mgnify:FL=1